MSKQSHSFERIFSKFDLSSPFDESEQSISQANHLELSKFENKNILMVFSSKERLLSIIEANPTQPPPLAALIEIENSVHQKPWTASQLASSLNNHDCWLMYCNQTLIGYLVVQQILDECEILNIAIEQSFQGQGLGGLWLDFLNIYARNHSITRIILEVRESNHPALNLYQAKGFTIDGVRPNYYPCKNGFEDAILMSLWLDKAPVTAP